MPLPVQCSNCNSRFNAHDGAVGHTLPCPNCGNKIKIAAPEVFDAAPVVQVSQEDIEQAIAESGGRSNATIIGACIAVALLVVGVVSYLALKPTQGLDIVAEAVSIDDTNPTVEQVRDAENSIGLGFSVAEFKVQIANDYWKIIEETTRPDGTVYCRLAHAKEELFTVAASGNPDNIAEVSMTAIVYNDKTTDAELFAQLVVISAFFERLTLWTSDELNQYFAHIIVGGAAHKQQESEPDYFKVSKDGQEINLAVIGATDGAMMFIGVTSKPDSKAPKLQEWMTLHPNPPPKSGKTHYHAAQTTGKVENAGLTFKNFHAKNERGDLIGEMVNRSSRMYQVAMFNVSVYDREGSLIDTQSFSIINFKPGDTRTFQFYVDILPGYYSYKFDLEHGL